MFPYENIYLVIEQFLLSRIEKTQKTIHFPLQAIKKISSVERMTKIKKWKNPQKDVLLHSLSMENE